MATATMMVLPWTPCLCTNIATAVADGLLYQWIVAFIFYSLNSSCCCHSLNVATAAGATTLLPSTMHHCYFDHIAVAAC